MKQAFINPKEYFTIREAATITGVGYHNLYRWVRRGYLPTTRFGYTYAVRGSDLLATIRKWRNNKLSLDMPRHGLINELVAAK